MFRLFQVSLRKRRRNSFPPLPLFRSSLVSFSFATMGLFRSSFVFRALSEKGGGGDTATVLAATERSTFGSGGGESVSRLEPSYIIFLGALFKRGKKYCRRARTHRRTSTNRMQSILKRSLKLCFRADVSMRFVFFLSTGTFLYYRLVLSLVFWY